MCRQKGVNLNASDKLFVHIYNNNRIILYITDCNCYSVWIVRVSVACCCLLLMCPCLKPSNRLISQFHWCLLSLTFDRNSLHFSLSVASLSGRPLWKTFRAQWLQFSYVHSTTHKKRVCKRTLNVLGTCIAWFVVLHNFYIHSTPFHLLARSFARSHTLSALCAMRAWI